MVFSCRRGMGAVAARNRYQHGVGPGRGSGGGVARGRGPPAAGGGWGRESSSGGAGRGGLQSRRHRSSNCWVVSYSGILNPLAGLSNFSKKVIQTVRFSLPLKRRRKDCHACFLYNWSCCPKANSNSSQKCWFHQSLTGPFSCVPLQAIRGVHLNLHCFHQDGVPFRSFWVGPRLSGHRF